MSEVTPEEQPEVDVNKLQEQMAKMQEQLEQATSSKDRVLDESKNWKKKFTELKGQVDERESADLEKRKEYQTLLEREREKSANLENRIKGMEKKSQKQDLNFKVASLCPDAHDVADVIGSLDHTLMGFDDEGNIIGIEDAVNKSREAKPYLFKKETATTVGGRPSAIKNEPVPFSKKSAAEQDAELIELLKQG